MPAEWETHEATWLSWPKNTTTFPPDILPDVERTYVKMVESLATGEKVIVLVDDANTESKVRTMLQSKYNVFFQMIKSVDVWMRDYGPIFVKKDSKVALTKWIFNAWGNKYDDLLPDNEAGLKIAKSTGLQIFEPGIVLEGGSIDVNGKGTLLTTKQCLLNQNRNPKLNHEEIGWHLKEFLGATNIIWLDSGIEGDDTDGHVDDTARFVNEGTVIAMSEDDSSDVNHQALRNNYDSLGNARDQDGQRLNVVEVQMPGKFVSNESRLPASYANFYIGNSVVLVPTFDDPMDGRALETISKFFRERKVLGINCTSLVWGFGSIHCVTQQQPSYTTNLHY